MITKIRKTIAYTISIFVMLLSLGIAKPNFSGEPITSDPGFNNKSVISIDIDKNHT